MDASIFDSALGHTLRSDGSEKREEKSASTFGRFRMWTSFESSPVSVKHEIRHRNSGMNFKLSEKNTIEITSSQYFFLID